jgi:hypothetical protein
MDAEIVVIRLLHIIPGAVWVGTAVLMALVIGPRLNSAGTVSSLTSDGDIAGGAATVMNVAGIFTILFGLALIFRTVGFSQLFSGGWGWSIGIGLVLSIFAMGTGGALTSTLRRLYRATSSSSEQRNISGDNDSLATRVGMISYINAILVVVAIGAMAAARFV